MRLFSLKQCFVPAAALALALTMWSTGAAGQETSFPSADEKGEASRGSGDVYSVINLASPRAFSRSVLNERGQAAFDDISTNGSLKAVFFDGDRIRDIAPANADSSFTGDLNDKGEVTISAFIRPPENPDDYIILPLRWSAARGHVPLPSFNPRGYTRIGDINNRSESIGFSGLANENSTFRAVRWTSTNRLLALPSPAGFGQTDATDISERNLVVGSGVNAAGRWNVLVWNAHGQVTNLGTFGTQEAAALLVNDRADIAGATGFESGNAGSFLWSPGKPVIHLPAAYIRSLNEKGELVGIRTGTVANAFYAFRYSRERGLVNLHPARFFLSDAVDVNDSGTVVGVVRTTLFDAGRAMHWSPAGIATDLNTRLVNAPASLVLNEGVQISGNGNILAASNAGLVYLRRGGDGTDAPVMGPIVVPELQAGQSFTLSLLFTDRNRKQTHTATIDWDDGNGPVPAIVRESNGRGEVRADHTYPSFGNPVITVRVTDSGGRSTTTDQEFFVDGPFRQQLVGSGTLQFDGPRLGAQAPEASRPSAARASFHLSAPLVLGTDAGARFLFRIHGNSSFRAERLDHVQRNGDRVRLVGTGTLNGRSGYRFDIDAISGGQPGASGPGKLSVRIVPATSTSPSGEPGATTLEATRSVRRAPETSLLTGMLHGGTIRLRE